MNEQQHRLRILFQFHVTLCAEPIKYHTRCAACFVFSFELCYSREKIALNCTSMPTSISILIKQTANIENTIKTWANYYTAAEFSCDFDHQHHLTANKNARIRYLKPINIEYSEKLAFEKARARISGWIWHINRSVLIWFSSICFFLCQLVLVNSPILRRW